MGEANINMQVICYKIISPLDPILLGKESNVD